VLGATECSIIHSYDHIRIRSATIFMIRRAITVPCNRRQIKLHIIMDCSQLTQCFFGWLAA
jgi:hypothetical protein